MLLLIVLGTSNVFAVIPPVSIPDVVLREPQNNVFYLEHIQATGGVPSYHWSIIGSLPSGLSLDPSSGVISGITSYDSGIGLHFDFTARVADFYGTFAEHHFFGSTSAGSLPSGSALAAPTGVCVVPPCSTPTGTPPPTPSIDRISITPLIVGSTGQTTVNAQVSHGVGDTTVTATIFQIGIGEVSHTDLSLSSGSLGSGSWSGTVRFQTGISSHTGISIPAAPDSDSIISTTFGKVYYVIVVTATNNLNGGISSSNPKYSDVFLDRTPPIVTTLANRLPDNNGWYNHPVIFSTVGDDGTGIGIMSCDRLVNYLGPDGTLSSIPGHCTDFAGNVGNIITTINYDSTPPVITTSQQGTIFDLGQRVVPDATCTDATSGISSCVISVPSLDTSSYGGKSYSVISTDNAGNTARLTVSYTVAPHSTEVSPTISGSGLGSSSTNTEFPSPIPTWIKNNAKWWSSGQIDDSEFVKGMQYLVQNGMIDVSAKSNSNQTCQQGYYYDAKTNSCLPNQPTCKDGYYYDAKTNSCLPNQPTCKDGYYYDAKSNSCLPK